MKSRGFKIFAIITIGIIILSATCLLAFYLSVTDTNNVILEGCVLDFETNKPVKGAKVELQNYRYQNDEGFSNYDEYLGLDEFQLVTDEKGFYKIKMDKSAFIIIKVDTEGYASKSESKYASKSNKFKTILEKTNHSKQ